MISKEEITVNDINKFLDYKMQLPGFTEWFLNMCDEDVQDYLDNEAKGTADHLREDK